MKKEMRSKNPDTLTLLTGAIVLNKISVIKKLLSHCDTIDINVPDAHKNIPIFVCVKFGRVECLKLLLQHNANPDITDSRGYTPLIYALREEKYLPNRYLIVKTLLEHNCNTQFISNVGTPMFIARKLRRPIYVHLLQRYNAV